MSMEREYRPTSGYVVLSILSAAQIAVIAAFIWAVRQVATLPKGVDPAPTQVATVLSMVLLGVILIVFWAGFFTLQPNASAVLTLFGAYKGSVRTAGFHWANPFFRKNRISLRARNLNGAKLKVNDQRGNPIEIATVVVWRVEDTARAVFEVDNYVDYVAIQSEGAVRHMASAYPYDAAEEHKTSLRGSMDEIAKSLRVELQQRLSKAGVVVDEAWLSHLAYAPEIASVMLRRQQAEAVVAARTRIVEGAMGMVQLALAHIEKDGIVDLDAERKAAMVTNLLVVLCGEQAAQPVVNTGSLYT